MDEFETIYRQYFRDVYLYVLRLSGGDEALASDVVSETFFRALRAIDGFRGGCSLRVWLCQIAKHCYFDTQRRARRDAPEDAALELVEDGDTPERIFLRKEEAGRVRRQIRALEEPYRSVFLRRAEEGASFRQIGAAFGKSENWACVTYHRARKKLMERMEDESDEK